MSAALSEIMRPIAVPIVCLLFAALFGTASAAELDDKVAGRADLTYYDLVKLIVTDLPPADSKGEPSAHEIAPYRHIGGKGAKTGPAGPVAVKYISPLEVHSGGARRLALLADLGDSDMAVAAFVLLGLFDLSGKPKLLDLVEVGSDRLTGFADDPVHALGSGSDLIIIHSEHFDAGMDYVNTELVLVRNDRFELAASVSTFGYSTCIYTFTETPRIDTRPGRPYKSILLAVRETLRVQDDHGNCDGAKEPRPFTRTPSATYRWNARRRTFVTTSTELENLEKLNMKLIMGSGIAPWER
jgi:hypothetical protein